MLKRFNLSCCIISFLVVLFALPTVTMAGNAEIVTVAYGTRHVKPDRATIDVEVETTGSSAVSASDSNAIVTASVIDALKIEGTDEGYIHTMDYSVYPQYKKEIEKRYTNRSPEPEYFSAVHRIRVWIDDLDEIGKIYDVALAAGATKVRNIEYTVKNMEEIKRLALVDAVRQVEADAKAMAEAIGGKLGELITLTTQVPKESFDPALRGGSGRERKTSIIPKEIRVNAKVMGKWYLENE